LMGNPALPSKPSSGPDRTELIAVHTGRAVNAPLTIIAATIIPAPVGRIAGERLQPQGLLHGL
jgi:hypothetical protein